MPSRLTFGVELEFALAALQPGRPDPEPHLPQPVFVLPGLLENPFQQRFVVFDAIAAKLVAAGLPARSIRLDDDPYATIVSSDSSSSSRASRYQNDGVGWLPSRRHRWVREDEEPLVGAGSGDADREPEQGGKSSNSKENDEERSRINQRSEFRTPSPEGLPGSYGPEWIVTEDWTVGPTRPNDYDWIAVEVQSPPYIFSADALQAIQLACHTLTHNFRLETNSTTGLHVHVGHGADGPPYPTLRNLLAFLWTFEPQLDQLHPTRRAGLPGSGGGSGESYTWYESLRRGSRLSRGEHDLSFRRPRSVLAGLRAIYGVEPAGAEALYGLTRAVAWKAAYHLGHVAYAVEEGRHCASIKRTVEFRQCRGMVDGGRVAWWVRTVVGVVEFVGGVDDLVLLEFLTEACGVEDGEGVVVGDAGGGVGMGMGTKGEGEEKVMQYDIVQLLRDIGLEDCAAYWDEAIPVAERLAPTPYHWSPRKLKR